MELQPPRKRSHLRQQENYGPGEAMEHLHESTNAVDREGSEALRQGSMFHNKCSPYQEALPGSIQKVQSSDQLQRSCYLQEPERVNIRGADGHDTPVGTHRPLLQK